ncbi:MAG: chaperone modulator CbpM [Flavisolibacter sp.]
MQNDQWISEEEVCFHYNVEYSFITSLYQAGLIEYYLIEEKRFIPTDRLEDLEKFVRFHYDLEINIEGIEVIHRLLQKINDLERELNKLNSRQS